jgi:type IV pilus assembly protein PilB
MVIKRKRLGEMLVEEKLISPERLEEILEPQGRSGQKLGEYLVREGLIREEDMISVVSRQLGVRRYQSELFPVDSSLADYLPVNQVMKYQAVPLVRKGSVLVMALRDPTDIYVLDALEVFTNLEVEAVICTEQEFNQLVAAVYGASSGLVGALEEIREKVEAEDADSGIETAPVTRDLDVTSLQAMAADAPVVKLVNTLLSQAVRERASDVHISPEKDHVQVRFRVDGKLFEVPAPPQRLFLPMVSRIKVLAGLDIAVSRIPQDGRFTIRMGQKEINIRVSTLPTIYGENIVMRILDTSAGVQSLENLGMDPRTQESIRAVIRKPYGMILAAGPTGSGKSTSLYAMLKEINRPDINIVTLEDPVEFRVDKIRQVQLNRKAGMTFASGLRSILRQDPDVVMVGEIRDSETASIAVQAGLTGHRVFSTVHTNDAAGAITRFLDMGVEPFLVSSVMLATIAQRLVRRICPYCAEFYQPAAAVLENWGLQDHKGGTFMRGKGCPNCMHTGYLGRVGIYELLINDEGVQEMILENRSAKEISRTLQEAGKLKTLKEDAVDKILAGKTTFEEAASAVMV